MRQAGLSRYESRGWETLLPVSLVNCEEGKVNDNLGYWTPPSQGLCLCNFLPWCLTRAGWEVGVQSRLLNEGCEKTMWPSSSAWGCRVEQPCLSCFWLGDLWQVINLSAFQLPFLWNKDDNSLRAMLEKLEIIVKAHGTCEILQRYNKWISYTIKFADLQYQLLLILGSIHYMCKQNFH